MKVSVPSEIFWSEEHKAQCFCEERRDTGRVTITTRQSIYEKWYTAHMHRFRYKKKDLMKKLRERYKSIPHSIWQ